MNDTDKKLYSTSAEERVHGLNHIAAGGGVRRKNIYLTALRCFQNCAQ